MPTKLPCLLALALAAPALAETPEAYVAAARAAMVAQNEAHQATLHLADADHWDADLDKGTIVFTFKDGKTATAPIQVVGTLSVRDGSFLWGWDHPSVPEPLRKHAALARKWGEQERQASYTTRKVPCTEDEAWSFAAVASRLGKANGVFRGPSGNAVVFMTFGELTVKKPTVRKK